MRSFRVYRHLNIICERLLKEREELMKEEYDKVLTCKLAGVLNSTLFKSYMGIGFAFTIKIARVRCGKLTVSFNWWCNVLLRSLAFLTGGLLETLWNYGPLFRIVFASCIILLQSNTRLSWSSIMINWLVDSADQRRAVSSQSYIKKRAFFSIETKCYMYWILLFCENVKRQFKVLNVNTLVQHWIVTLLD